MRATAIDARLIAGTIVLLVGLATPAQSVNAEDFRGPWRADSFVRSPGPAFAQSSGGRQELTPARLIATPVYLYAAILTTIDGRDCPCWPPCSRYALEAIQRFGLVKGLFLTADRLIHEPDQVHLGPLISTPVGLRCFDPLPQSEVGTNRID